MMAFCSLSTASIYYQTRRILMEMQAPLPENRAWDAVNNPYDRQEYEKICDKFGVSPNSDWKVHGPSQGLGLCYNYMHGHYHKVGNGDYDPKKMSFAEHIYDVRVNYIKQEAGVSRAWRLFILNKSDGLTQPGVARLNGCILTYIWAVLGAQAQVRTEIIGVRPAFYAQGKFLSNVEDAIADPVDISEAVERYENSVQHARSEVSFSFGEGLYMAPSYMLLHMGKIVGYNNLLMVATSAQHLGANISLNKSAAPPDVSNDTGEKGLVKPMSAEKPQEATTSQPPTTPDIAAAAKADHEAHEDEKTALIVGSIAIDLGLLWFLG